MVYVRALLAGDGGVTITAIAGRAEARRLPSRHRFAIARLAAFVLLHRGARQTTENPEHIILHVDRDQSSAEAYAVAVWIFLTTGSYFAGTLPLPLPLSILAAIPLAFLAFHIPIVGGGLLLRLLAGDGNHIRTVSAGSMGMLLIWSFYIARAATWPRIVAWFFFAVLTGNAIAAVILWIVRGRVRAAEARCVE